MPRRKRELSKLNQYHLISRGINKSPIFLDEQDLKVFVSILKNKAQKLNVSIYAYCLMKNHYHILAGSFNNNLSVFMQMIGTTYALYFNNKYKRIGSLFQDRFKSEPVNDEKYFITLIRYIHQNPEKAKIGKTITYKWSSIKAYLGFPSFIETNLALDILGGLHNFVNFVTEKNDDICMEYTKLDVTDEIAQKDFQKILNTKDLRFLYQLSTVSRNKNLRIIKNKGYPYKQISRITGFSISQIKDA